jgi:polyisoprenoid-binding protein YceI
LARWFFEAGHTAAEFFVRHMMVTYVRGHFKNIRGQLNFDPANPQRSSVEIEIDASGLWTGEPDRDAHLRSADFLDVEHFKTITFRSREVSLLGDHDYPVLGDLTIRGVTRPCKLRVTYLG